MGAGRPVTMEIVQRVVGPLATNLYLVADVRSREAIAIDTAIRRSTSSPASWPSAAGGSS